MTKQELIERVAARLGQGKPVVPKVPKSLKSLDELPKKTVALVIDTVFAELGEYFIKARVTPRRVPRFTYPGFGTFTKKARNARPGRNPQSGEPIEIPASTTVGFQPGQDLRAELNRPAPAQTQVKSPRAKAKRHG